MRTTTYILILTITLSIWSCKTDTEKEAMENTIVETEIKPITNDVLESAVIYEANIRQYSAEGTFDAFTRDIPQLRELGVKIIWLMPVYPISKVKRKAYGDLMVEDIEDPAEREKYLGSYYAVSDFKAINPEFGTIEDFRELVKTAHDNGIYVILDWVPNHTGWDHVWITENPDFYTKNANGEITDPLNADGSPVGWQDVADLNYDNMEMQEAMINDMLHWIREENIDGFRCDMAGMVPTSFWRKAIPRLRSEKDIFMLAEGDNPELCKDDLFEMAYGWEVHHLLNAIAKGEKSVYDFDNYMAHSLPKWEEDDILMNFVTNHDENSWAGSVPERLGPAADAITALTFCMPGMPLIYSGQEYNLDHRLKFFEKDSIPKEKKGMWELLSKLGTAKNGITALNGGKDEAGYERLSTSDDSRTLCFRRAKNGNELIYIANFSNESNKVGIPFSGNFTEIISGEREEVSSENAYALEPWEVKILVPQGNE